MKRKKCFAVIAGLTRKPVRLRVKPAMTKRGFSRVMFAVAAAAVLTLGSCGVNNSGVSTEEPTQTTELSAAQTTEVPEPQTAALSPDGTSVALFVRADGLYAVDIPTGIQTLIDADSGIGVTKDSDYRCKIAISDDNKFAAYFKNGALFVTPISFDEGTKARPVEATGPNVDLISPVVDFVFAEGKLFYSIKNGGLYAYDLTSGARENVLPLSYTYYGLVAYENTIYARREIPSANAADAANATDGANAANAATEATQGVVKISLADKSETLLAEDIPMTEDAGIAERWCDAIGADSRFVYILSMPHSASIAADGVDLGACDLAAGQFTPNCAGMLAHYDNFSLNPAKPGEAAFIHGGNREMSINKSLALFNAADGQFTDITDKNNIATTPCFSPDGKKILFSEGGAIADFTQALDSVNGFKSYYDAHSIVEYDIENKTFNTVCDVGFNFLPRYVSDGSIAFLRYNGSGLDNGSFDLYVNKNGENRLVVSDIYFDYNVGMCYYGYFDTSSVFAVNNVVPGQ